MTIQEFWKLLGECNLLPAEKCSKLAETYGRSSKPQTAEEAASWLVEQKVLTRFHTKILLAGRPGPFVYGEYKLYDRVTQGRLTGLFKAVHGRTGHRVLLQFLSAAAVQTEASLNQVRSSAAKAIAVQSPYVQRCYEFVDLPDYKFFVLEDLSGDSAEQKLQAGKLPPLTAAAMVRDVALGLAALHEKQFEHGDIRPENIWLTKNEHAKLLYIPLGRDPAKGPVGRSRLSDADVLAQVANYVAPEIIQGRPADSRSDVYALGATLYRMSTSRPPFTETDLKAKLQAHIANEPMSAHQVRKDVPEAISMITGYMLIKDPDSRYQTAGEVAEALAPYLDPKWLETTPDVVSANSLKAYEKWLATRSSAPKPAAAPQPAPAATPKPAAAQPMAAQPIPTQSAPAAAPMAAPVAQAPAAAPSPAPVASAPVAAAPIAAAPVAAAPVASAPVAVAPVATAPAAAAPIPAVGGKNKPSLAQQRGEKVREKNKWIQIGGIAFAACILVVLLIYSVGGFGGSGDGDEPPVAQGDQNPPDASGNGTNSGNQGTSNTNNANGGASDTTTQTVTYEPITGIDGPMWEPPTHGSPLELNYFPRGVQMFIALRPASLLAHPEGPKLIDTLGGLGKLMQDQIPALTGQPLNQLDQVIVGLLGNSAGKPPRVCLVAHTTAPFDHASWLGAVGNPTKAMADGKSFYISDEFGYYAPEQEGNRLIVVAPAEPNQALAETKAPIVESLEFAESSTPLGRLGTLLKTTDANRHCTVLFAPSFLFTDGKSMFSGEAAALKEPLDMILRDEVGGAFSAQFDGDRIFLELAVMGRADKAPQILAGDLRDRLANLPIDVESGLASINNISAYSRLPLLRYPRMLEALQGQTTAGHTEKTAVLTTYLPAVAAHNLAFGTRLALIEKRGGGGTVIASSTPTKDPETAEEKLAQVTSLSFTKDTLERSIALLAEEIDLEMEILGGDLQIEGITKNQSFELDQRDKPASEILKTILKKASPEGKLVYVIRKEGDTEKVYITTKVKAAQRGETPISKIDFGQETFLAALPWPVGMLGMTNFGLLAYAADDKDQPNQETIEQKLGRVISFEHDRITLANSMKQLAKQIDTEIEILGLDLQFEGITKNQSFGMQIKDKPALEVLQTILERTSPGGAQDRRLIYVIKQDETTKADKIFITTPRAAAKRGDKLPTLLVSDLPKGRPPATSKNAAPSDVKIGLAKVTSLAFDRETLEKSLQMLAQKCGIEIEILGADLQLEGITKNQSFGLKAYEVPAGEILRTILRKANLDDKLVYVVRKDGKSEKLYITTRQAAEKRGEKLPPELVKKES